MNETPCDLVEKAQRISGLPGYIVTDDDDFPTHVQVWREAAAHKGQYRLWFDQDDMPTLEALADDMRKFLRRNRAIMEGRGFVFRD